MDKERVREIVAYLESKLRESGIEPFRTFLFGSHKSGTPHEDSDIDLYVISPVFEGKDIFERAHMTASAERMAIRKFMVPLDIINVTSQEFEETSLFALTESK